MKIINTKTKIILFLLMMLIFTGVIEADTITGRTVLNRPMKYNLPKSNDKLEIDISPVADKDRMSVVWEVYSDRDNNETYATSKMKKSFKTLKFLDDLFVIEEQGELLHIVKDPGFERDVCSSLSEDMGWINKKNLLLWNHDLVTERGKINRKAMILNTVEQLRSESEDDQPDIVRFRRGPGLKANKTGELSQLFQFFYIYKISEDGRSVLLGKNSFFGQTSVKRIIKGWVPRSRSILWFNRIAIEPNWEPASVIERMDGKKVTFFSDKNNTEFFKAGIPIDPIKIIWNNDPLSKQRLIGEWRRFPVLRKDDRDGDILTTGVMGDIYTNQGKLLIKETKRIAEMKRKIDTQIAHKRSIKIVFIVDGTKSMNNVFKAVSGSVEAVTKKLNLEYRGKYGENAIDFAGVIYRDYSEDRSRRYRTRGFNSSKSFDQFFDPKEARDVNNTTHAEAMYLGLETALLSLGLDKDQTNVLILIGDAGNHYPDKEGRTADRIAELMAEKYCHFIAIQAQHTNGIKAYDDFIYQNKIIAESAARKYRKILMKQYKDIFDLSELKWKIEDGKYNLEQSPLAAKVIGLENGQSLSKVEIQKEIEHFIKGVDSSNDSLIAKLNKIVAGAGFRENGDADEIETDQKKDFYTLPFAEGIWAVFQQSGLSLEELATLKVDKYQVYTPGYTTMQVAGQGNPLFRRVLLMDATELGDLERSIRKLRNASTGSQRREALYNTWLEILKEYLGEVENEASLKNLSLEEINNKIWELPGTHSILGNIKLKDIHDEHKFTDAQLNDYIENILEKHEKLRNIFFSLSYKYGFRSNERPYYWIEEDLLP